MSNESMVSIAPAPGEETMLPRNAMQLTDLLQQMAFLRELMGHVMREGEHYGKIPGTFHKCTKCKDGKIGGKEGEEPKECPDCRGTGETGKPTLLKSGAEKLRFVFRLSAEPEITIVDLPGGHRTVRVKTAIRSIRTGVILAYGAGEASTLETKWRYRTGPKEITGELVPPAYWQIRKTDPEKGKILLGGAGFTTAKGEDGKWYIAKQGERIEHDNPADYFNTVLKMAKKRAEVDGTLAATAASDYFTQDLEEMPESDAASGSPGTQESNATPAAAKPVLAEHEKNGKKWWSFNYEGQNYGTDDATIRQAVEEWLKLNPLPKPVMIFEDFGTLRVLSSFNDASIPVPDDEPGPEHSRDTKSKPKQPKSESVSSVQDLYALCLKQIEAAHSKDTLLAALSFAEARRSLLGEDQWLRLAKRYDQINADFNRSEKEPMFPPGQKFEK